MPNKFLTTYVTCYAQINPMVFVGSCQQDVETGNLLNSCPDHEIRNVTNSNEANRLLLVHSEPRKIYNPHNNNSINAFISSAETLIQT